MSNTIIHSRLKILCALNLNIFSNETPQVIHLDIVPQLPQGLMPCFFYCLKHIAACQCCGSWVPVDYLFYHVHSVGAVVHQCFVRKSWVGADMLEVTEIGQKGLSIN